MRRSGAPVGSSAPGGSGGSPRFHRARFGLGPRTSWRQDVSQSGVILDVGVHLLDLIPWVTGQHFVEVSAFTHPDRRRGEPDDTVTILGRLDGDCHAVVRATREVASAENNLIIEGSEATLITSALRFAPEHVVRVRDRAGTTEERFRASPAYALEIRAFEGELRGERSLLPVGRTTFRHRDYTGGCRPSPSGEAWRCRHSFLRPEVEAAQHTYRRMTYRKLLSYKFRPRSQAAIFLLAA